MLKEFPARKTVWNFKSIWKRETLKISLTSLSPLKKTFFVWGDYNASKNLGKLGKYVIQKSILLALNINIILLKRFRPNCPKCRWFQNIYSTFIKNIINLLLKQLVKVVRYWDFLQDSKLQSFILQYLYL